MPRHFSPYPRFALLLWFALSLFGLSMWAVADAKAAVSYSFTIFDVPGAVSTSAVSINASGQVAGNYTDGSDGTHGFVYGNGAYTTIDVPGAVSTSAVSINASGQVAGNYFADSELHGFVYGNGMFTTIDVSGAIYTVVISINASGQVAGRYRIANSSKVSETGFVYSNGTFTTFTASSPGSVSHPILVSVYPTSINASGQVTGCYGGFCYDLLFNAHGFVYGNNTFATVDVPDAIGTWPTSINASGQVAGYYRNGSSYHGFIATPIDAPTTIPTLSEWAMLLLMSLLLGYGGWRLRSNRP